jgi:hypothetical protein
MLYTATTLKFASILRLLETFTNPLRRKPQNPTMKNKLFIMAGLVFSLRAGAQNSQTVYSEDKSSSMYRNLDGSRFSPIPATKVKPESVHTLANAKADDYFCMQHDKVYAVVNGTRTCLDTYMKLQDGSMIMPNGALITGSGKIIHLKNGESISVQGTMNTVSKAAGKKDQAGITEN